MGRLLGLFQLQRPCGMWWLWCVVVWQGMAMSWCALGARWPGMGMEEERRAVRVRWVRT